MSDYSEFVINRKFLGINIFQQKRSGKKILNLVINGYVEVTEFNEKNSYLNGLIKRERKNYALSIINEYQLNDEFSKRVFKVIQKVTTKYNERRDIGKFIKMLVNDFLGGMASDEPEREFLVRVLELYDHNDWLVLKMKRNFVKPNYIIEIDAKQLSLLEKEFDGLYGVQQQKKQRPSWLSELL